MMGNLKKIFNRLIRWLLLMKKNEKNKIIFPQQREIFMPERTEATVVCLINKKGEIVLPNKKIKVKDLPKNVQAIEIPISEFNALKGLSK